VRLRRAAGFPDQAFTFLSRRDAAGRAGRSRRLSRPSRPRIARLSAEGDKPSFAPALVNLRSARLIVI